MKTIVFILVCITLITPLYNHAMETDLLLCNKKKSSRNNNDTIITIVPRTQDEWLEDIAHVPLLPLTKRNSEIKPIALAMAQLNDAYEHDHVIQENRACKKLYTSFLYNFMLLPHELQHKIIETMIKNDANTDNIAYNEHKVATNVFLDSPLLYSIQRYHESQKSYQSSCYPALSILDRFLDVDVLCTPESNSSSSEEQFGYQYTCNAQQNMFGFTICILCMFAGGMITTLTPEYLLPVIIGSGSVGAVIGLGCCCSGSCKKKPQIKMDLFLFLLRLPLLIAQANQSYRCML